MFQAGRKKSIKFQSMLSAMLLEVFDTNHSKTLSRVANYPITFGKSLTRLVAVIGKSFVLKWMTNCYQLTLDPL